MSKKDKEEEECLKYPDALKLPNWKLPFLTYGFFKPDQLAFSQIKEYTNKKITPVYINAKLKHVNGMPVLVKEFRDGSQPVKGYVIRFRKKDSKKAYELICKSKDMHIYKWDTLKIDNQTVNVLVSADPEKMKNIYRDPDMPDPLQNLYDYQWENDPVYKNMFYFIDSRFDEVQSKISTRSINPNTRDLAVLFVEVQSLYMVLWSALDRFLTFRYGLSQKKNLISLSEEEFFKDALEEHVKSNHTVLSAENLKQITLDKKSPKCSAFYYYTLRNNVVHNGKMNVNEIEMLFDALKELLNIFEYILNAVKDETKKNLYDLRETRSEWEARENPLKFDSYDELKD